MGNSKLRKTDKKDVVFTFVCINKFQTGAIKVGTNLNLLKYDFGKSLDIFLISSILL